MGGMPPLGYDVENRKLVVNDAEAQTVVDIFRRYLALKSVHALRDALADAGIKSKRRLRPDGTEYGGQKCLTWPGAWPFGRNCTPAARSSSSTKASMTRTGLSSPK
jgi:hypothetical protein